MSKFKVINIVDIVFISVVTFLIFFAWVQFFLKNLLLSLLLSCVLSLCFLTFVRWLSNKKYAYKQSIIDKASNFNRFKLAITTMTNARFLSIIKQLIPEKYPIKTNKNSLTFTKNDSTTLVMFHFKTELNQLTLLDIIKSNRYNNIIVFCYSFDQESKSISQSFKHKNITLINIEQLFDLVNDNNIEINTSNINIANRKSSVKQIFKTLISKNKAKSYFISGLIILFTSIIIPFKIYYVVLSSILFVLSLACKIKPTDKINMSIFE